MCRIGQRLFLPVLLIAAVLVHSACILPQETNDLPSVPQKNTLTLFDTGPSTLDPAVSQEASSHAYIIQIFSGLVALNENMEPEPDLAESWDVSDNGQVYTFHLRRNATFHDGTKVTAADFEYSWERACRPETDSPTAPTYLNDIVGVTEMLAGTAGEIEGVKVIDDYTLQVTIDAPKAAFLAKLTYPVAFVVDEANAKSGGEWWHQPNGTGPFRLKEWTEDELLLLQRNDSYYRDKAKLDYVAFLLWGGMPMEMYEMGEIDVTDVYLSDLDRAMDEANPLHQELNVFPELSLTYIGFDTTKPPFNDPRVRRAFCYAIDKDRLIGQLLKGAVTRADGILPPGMPGYSENVQGLGYDLEQATALLAEAGYGGDTVVPSLVFTDPGEGGNVSTWLTSILWQWEQSLGVDIEIRQIDSETYMYRLDEEKDAMYSFGWVADYPDPQNFLEVLFHSESVNNYGEYSNPEVDSLLEQAAVEQDSTARLELYRQAEQLIVSDAACVPLWFGSNYVLVKPHVKGYTIGPLGVPLLAEVSVED